MSKPDKDMFLSRPEGFSEIPEDKKGLFRLGVGVVLENKNGKIFYALRSDEEGQGDWVVDTEGEWVMPQGGIDGQDDLFETLKRELFEEAGIKPEHIELVQARDDFLAYKFEPLIEPATWIGQAHCWFHCKFIGDPEQDINLAAASPQEFQKFSWSDPGFVLERAQSFHANIYKEVLQGFGFEVTPKPTPVPQPRGMDPK